MRALAVVLALAIAGCSSAPQTLVPTPSRTHDPNVLSVSVLLDLSGPRAPSGDRQRDAMQLWLDQATSRPSRPQMRVKFIDVASSDAKTLIELRHAVVDDRADAVVVGAAVTLDATFTRASAVAGVPVIVTLPMGDPRTLDGGRWVFALAPPPEAALRAVLLDMAARGPATPILVVTDESRAAGAERLALGALLDRMQLVRPTAVALGPGEQAARIRAGAAVARNVVLLGPASGYPETIRSIAGAATAPRVYLSWLTETVDITDLREASAFVLWPGSRNVGLPSGTRTATRAAFLQTYTTRHGSPSTLAATAYDALTLLQAAAQGVAPPVTAEKLRLAIEAGAVEGVAARYTFSAERHSGFPESDIAILHWPPRGPAPLEAPTPTPVRDVP